MSVPRIAGEIDRRLPANYRSDPEVAARVVPILLGGLTPTVFSAPVRGLGVGG